MLSLRKVRFRADPVPDRQATGRADGKACSRKSFTNATVANAVKGVDGQTVTVTYKGGEKKIDIPANVPVVAVVLASKEDIKPGAIVFVPTICQSDGSLTSGAVLFGKDGVIPPNRNR